MFLLKQPLKTRKWMNFSRSMTCLLLISLLQGWWFGLKSLTGLFACGPSCRSLIILVFMCQATVTQSRTTEIVSCLLIQIHQPSGSFFPLTLSAPRPTSIFFCFPKMGLKLHCEPRTVCPCGGTQHFPLQFFISILI